MPSKMQCRPRGWRRRAERCGVARDRFGMGEERRAESIILEAAMGSGRVQEMYSENRRPIGGDRYGLFVRARAHRCNTCVSVRAAGVSWLVSTSSLRPGRWEGFQEQDKDDSGNSSRLPLTSGHARLLFQPIRLFIPKKVGQDWGRSDKSVSFLPSVPEAGARDSFSSFRINFRAHVHSAANHAICHPHPPTLLPWCRSQAAITSVFIQRLQHHPHSQLNYATRLLA